MSSFRGTKYSSTSARADGTALNLVGVPFSLKTTIDAIGFNHFFRIYISQWTIAFTGLPPPSALFTQCPPRSWSLDFIIFVFRRKQIKMCAKNEGKPMWLLEYYILYLHDIRPNAVRDKWMLHLCQQPLRYLQSAQRTPVEMLGHLQKQIGNS